MRQPGELKKTFFYFIINFLKNKNFVNQSVNLQINDIRQLSIIIPIPDQLKLLKSIFERACNIQKLRFEGKISKEKAEKKVRYYIKGVKYAGRKNVLRRLKER